MHGTKVENFQVVKKVYEEVGAIERKEEKIELINGISNMLPYLREVSLNGLLKFSAFDTLNNEVENLTLWSHINEISNLTSLSIRDCDITDSILSKGVKGILKIRTVDLSKNPRITTNGWNEISSKISQENKLLHLVYQQGTISGASAQCLRDLFAYLTDLDLAECRFEGDSLQTLLGNMEDPDEFSKLKIKRISLKYCSLTKLDQELIEAINDISGSPSLIIHDSQQSNKPTKCQCCFKI